MPAVLLTVILLVVLLAALGVYVSPWFFVIILSVLCIAMAGRYSYHRW
jgi:hypothetical protein